MDGKSFPNGKKEIKGKVVPLVLALMVTAQSRSSVTR